MDRSEDRRITAWFRRAGADCGELAAALHHPRVRVARVGTFFDVVVTPAAVGELACRVLDGTGGRVGAVVGSVRGNWSHLVPAGTARAWAKLAREVDPHDAVCSSVARYVWLPTARPSTGAPVWWARPPYPDATGAPVLTNPHGLAGALARSAYRAPRSLKEGGAR